MSKFSFIILTFFWMTIANAQHDVDSLKEIIINPKLHDTTKLKALGFLMVNISSTSKEFDYYNEKFRIIANQTLNSGETNALVKEKAYDALGVYYVNKGFQVMQSDYLLTIKYLNKSLTYFSPKYFISDKYIAARGYGLVSLGVMYNKIGDTNKSIHNYFEALHIFEKIKDKNSISYALQSIANIYNEQKKYNDALKYYLKAYDIYYKSDKLSYQDKIQKVLLFIHISKCHLELNNCELSGDYLNKGLTIALKLDDKNILSETYFNLGQNEERCKNNIGAALAYYKKSLNNSKLPENKAIAQIAIGKALFKQKDYAEAEVNLRNGLDVSRKLNHLEFQKQSLGNLHLLYKERKQFKKALEANELYAMIKDSIKESQNENTLTKKQLQYEYEAKQSQLLLEQERKLNTIKLAAQKKNAQKNTLLIGLLSIVLLLIIGAYFLYKNYKQKQAIAYFEKNELNQKLLLSQMNPHFIFNSIDNIQSLIYNKQDKEAVNYLTKFSKLTRQILENSNESYITLREELTMIDNYLVIQQLLHNNKFEFNIKVDATLDPEIILLPPMLTQPFIENAIKHGLNHITEKGFINIDFKFQNDKLFFEITDNGNGFKDNQTINKKSLAMKITKERLANMAKNSDFEIYMENRIDDQKNTIGAKVFFEIPYIYEN